MFDPALLFVCPRNKSHQILAECSPGSMADKGDFRSAFKAAKSARGGAQKLVRAYAALISSPALSLLPLARRAGVHMC